ncbi:MAG: right-handed parallel beta-helix repeat-containing protein [Eubacteriales bacterium]|nr:right-handed parallel beta-helix repeat-containing protein [Eubacteriales bacterium]
MNKKDGSINIEEMLNFNLPRSYGPLDAAHIDNGGVKEQFIKAVSELPEEVTIIKQLNINNFKAGMVTQFYVSPHGNTEGDGSFGNPLNSIQRAISKASYKKGAVIWLRGGNYNVKNTIEIGAECSGTINSPLFISAYKDEDVVISGGVDIPVSSFEKANDETALTRLPEKSHGNVFVVDLKALGIKYYGSISAGGSPMLIIDGSRQTLARYPNKGEDEIVMGRVLEVGGVTNSISEFYKDNSSKSNGWEIEISDSHSLSWDESNDVWIFGAVYAEWEKSYYKVNINNERNSLNSSGKSQYGARYLKDNSYYFLNVFEELDTPGEWYLDRNEGKLYIWPVGDISKSKVTFVTSSYNILNLNNTENVIINGIKFEATLGKAVSINTGSRNMLQNCEITNTVSNNFYVKGGYKNGIIFSTLSKSDEAAVNLTSTGRSTLTPDNNFIQNCILKDPMIKYGIWISGVGTIVSHNYVSGSCIFLYKCNECVIEYNELDGGPYNTKDAGMIYASGGDPSSRGNHVRYNYMHDITIANIGVYFDDCSSGDYAYGNIVAGSKGISFFTHNGRENVFYNNISINAGKYAFSDSINYYDPKSSLSVRWEPISVRMLNNMKEINEETFTARYPAYTDYIMKLSQHVTERCKEGYARNRLEEYLRSPAYNCYENNVIIGTQKAFNISDIGRLTVTGLDNNYISYEDPGFKNMSKGNYNLKPGSAVFKKLKDYTAIPFDKIGLQRK